MAVALDLKKGFYFRPELGPLECNLVDLISGLSHVDDESEPFAPSRN